MLNDAVALCCHGFLIVVKYFEIGPSPSGKATGFGPVIRRFESYRPSHPDMLELPIGAFFLARSSSRCASLEENTPLAILVMSGLGGLVRFEPRNNFSCVL